METKRCRHKRAPAKYSNGKPGGFASVSSTDDTDLPPTKWVQLNGEGTHHRPGVVCRATFGNLGVYVFFGGSNEGAGESTIFEDVFLFDQAPKYGERQKRRGRRHIHDACTCR